jgi:hypothetical protein
MHAGLYLPSPRTKTVQSPKVLRLTATGRFRSALTSLFAPRLSKVTRSGLLRVGSAVFIFFQPKCFRSTLIQRGYGGVGCPVFLIDWSLFFDCDWAWHWAKTGQVFCGGGWWGPLLSSRSRVVSPTGGRQIKCCIGCIRIGNGFTLLGDRVQ